MRWRWLVAIVAIAAIAVGWWVTRAPSRANQPIPPVMTCVEPVAPTPTPAPAPAPKLGPDVWALLDRCLHTEPAGRWPRGVTVAQVRHWVEVEHDPTWLEPDDARGHAAWWLPLSGEGDPQMPSGSYISVPIDGTPCGGAIVN